MLTYRIRDQNENPRKHSDKPKPKSCITFYEQQRRHFKKISI